MAKIIFNLITLVALGFAIYAYFNPVSRIFHFTNSDALMHVTGFAVVSCLLVFALPEVKRRNLMFWTSFIGVLVEVAQPLLTRRRELSISDIGANGLGILIGVVIGTIFVSAASHLKSLKKKKAVINVAKE